MKISDAQHEVAQGVLGLMVAKVNLEKHGGLL